jgi:hypothetical protein
VRDRICIHPQCRFDPGERKDQDALADKASITALLRKLRLARGVTIAQIMEATSWQAHSARDLLSAVVRKNLELNLTFHWRAG